MEHMKTARFGSVPRVALVAGLAAALDLIARNSSAAWTESPITGLVISFSPAIYVALFTLVALELHTLPPKVSASTMRSIAVGLCVCAILIIVQVFTRGRSVGSAGYSSVLPLFVSGVPLAVLTFIVFFRSSRGPPASVLGAVVSVLWILMPIAIDTMYVTQGGYRGPFSPFQFAVLGTTYDFLVMLAGLGFFLSLLAVPLISLGGIYVAVRAPRSEKLCAVAVALSLLAFSVQIVNWGGFVWD